MNRRSFLYKVSSVLLLASLLLTSCKDELNNDVTTSIKQEQTKAKQASPYFEGMAYVKFKDGQQASEGFRAIRSTSVTLAESKVKFQPIFDLVSPKGQEMWGDWSEAIKREGLDRWYKVVFDKGVDVEEVTKELLANNDVELAEPVTKLVPVQPFYTPYQGEHFRADVASPVNSGYGGYTDPLLKVQWHYQNNSGYALEDIFVKGADINLFKAWDITKGRKEVVVAIIDSGIDLDHPDLKGSIWTNTKGEHGHDFVDDNSSIEAGYHGTHVAGTVAARNNNGEGGGGVAGGDGSPESGVRLMSCQVFGKDDAFGNAKSASAEGFGKAFVWAAKNGAVIANCSWGFPFLKDSDINNENYIKRNEKKFALMKEGINFFIKYAGHKPDGSVDPNAEMEGGIVLVASGNNGAKDIDIIPAYYHKVVAVGSFTSTFQLAKYTNTGDWVDILAPGGLTPLGSSMNGGILSTVPASFESMYFGDPAKGGFDAKQFVYPGYTRYAYAQGTSMATPHVTGIAALMVSHFGGAGKGLKAEELRKRLLGAVKAKDHEDINPKFRGKIGAGYIDALRALTDKVETEAPQPAENVSVSELEYYNARVKWQVSEDKDAYTKVAYAYDVYIEKGNKITSFKTPFTTVYTGDKKLGGELNCGFGKLQSNTEYTVVLIARDSYGNKSEKVQISFNTKENQLPKIINRPKEIRISDDKPFFHYSFKVKDEDEGQTWTFVTPVLPKGVSVIRKGDELELLIDVVKQGFYAFDIELKDNLGGVKVETIEYEVFAHTRTLVNYSRDLSLPTGKVYTLSASELFELKGEAITDFEFTLSSNNKQVASAEIKEGKILINPIAVGSATIIVTAMKNGREVSNAFLQVNVGEGSGSDVQTIYPIPAHSYVKILFASGVKEAEVIVTSLRGEVFIRKTLSVDQKKQEATLGVDKLAPAVYNMIIKTERTTSKRTFIKN